MFMGLDLDVDMFDNKAMSNINPRLALFLKEHPDKKDKDWAALFHVSRPHWSMIRRGKADPSKDLMQRIDALTGGEVPILSWFAVPSSRESHREGAR